MSRGSGAAERAAARTWDKPVTAWLTALEGVLVNTGRPVLGADTFIRRLRESGIPFLVLTNSSTSTPRDLRFRLLQSGIDVPEGAIWTSALATAAFLDDQRPEGTAYVVGDVGLTAALHEIGYVLTDRDPDYVVLGGTRVSSFQAVTTAIRLVHAGARFVATNPELTGPSDESVRPATGSVAALISRATGVDPYVVGKPNPLMVRAALNRLRAHCENTILIGHKMDTDIVAGVEAGMRTVLIRSGTTTEPEIDRFPYRPSRIVASVSNLIPEL